MDLPVKERFERMRVCVVVPTYNNARTLRVLLTDLLSYTDKVIVVNDGSNDGTDKILSEFPNLHLMSYKKNKGKGWALRSGFEKARAMGFHYAITIDSDGQHFPEDLPLFLDELERNPGCLIIGKRNMAQD